MTAKTRPVERVRVALRPADDREREQVRTRAWARERERERSGRSLQDEAVAAVADRVEDLVVRVARREGVAHVLAVHADKACAAAQGRGQGQEARGRGAWGVGKGRGVGERARGQEGKRARGREGGPERAREGERGQAPAEDSHSLKKKRAKTATHV